MINKLIGLVLVLCVFKCNGHLGILSDIVGGAHERIHSTVDKVAGGFLGGLNVNFQGHIGAGGQRYPNRPPPPATNGQTVVVVVEDHDNVDEQNGMTPNQYGSNNHQHRPGYNQGYGNQHQNGYQNQNQNGYQNQYGNQNHGHYAPQYPNQGHGNNEHNQGNNNGNGGYNQRPYQNPGNDGNGGYNQRPNQGNNQGNGGYNQGPYKNPGNYGNGGYNQRPNDNNQGNEPQQNNNGNYGQPTTPKQEEPKPTFGTIHEDQTQKPTTVKNDDKDEPLFVPLNPNQYNYGGDKDSNNSPKREADGDKASEDKDEDFPIDIRFQDQ